MSSTPADLADSETSNHTVAEKKSSLTSRQERSDVPPRAGATQIAAAFNGANNRDPPPTSAKSPAINGVVPGDFGQYPQSWRPEGWRMEGSIAFDCVGCEPAQGIRQTFWAISFALPQSLTQTRSLPQRRRQSGDTHRFSASSCCRFYASTARPTAYFLHTRHHCWFSLSVVLVQVNNCINVAENITSNPLPQIYVFPGPAAVSSSAAACRWRTRAPDRAKTDSGDRAAVPGNHFAVRRASADGNPRSGHRTDQYTPALNQHLGYPRSALISLIPAAKVCPGKYRDAFNANSRGKKMGNCRLKPSRRRKATFGLPARPAWQKARQTEELRYRDPSSAN